MRYWREQLAELIGTYCETATKILSGFRAARCLELRRGKILTLDHQSLEKIDPN